MTKEELRKSIMEIMQEKVRYKKSETMALDYGIASEQIPSTADDILSLCFADVIPRSEFTQLDISRGAFQYKLENFKNPAAINPDLEVEINSAFIAGHEWSIKQARK